MSAEQFQVALSTLQKRAATDEQFRELAKTDPRAALQEIGFDAPADLNLRFAEPEEGVAITLTPRGDGVAGHFSEAGDGALSDEHLESVSGGTQTTTVYTMGGLPRDAAHRLLKVASEIERTLVRAVVRVLEKAGRKRWKSSTRL